MKGFVVDAEWDPRDDYELTKYEKETKTAIIGNSVWRNPTSELRDLEKPDPGPEEVLIKVSYCGICGSDVHFLETDEEGYMLYPGLTRFPSVIGHEFSGIVEDIGENVTDVEKGDLVTSEEMVWCGHCIPCRNGYPNHCENLEELGITVDGGMEEYVAVNQRLVWSLNALKDTYGSEDEALKAGALVEPTSVAYHGLFIRGGGIKPGHYVTVFGAGPIGLGAIALANAAGASQVIAFEIKERRKKLAEKVGADYVFDPREVTPSEEINSLTDNRGTNLLVEAAGAPAEILPEAEKSIAINGKFVQIGRAAERVGVFLERYQVRRADIYGSQGHSGNEVFQNVIRMMAGEKINQRDIITNTYPLDEAGDAINKQAEREGGKVQVKVR